VGDYGGYSGLKSASIRGLGSAHTAIYVDGVRVGNVQSGQADLGNLDFASFGSIVADYAQNSISFITARPVFHNSPVAGTVSLQGGSFGTWKPYGNIAFRLSPKLSLSTHVGGLITKGAFPLSDGTTWGNNDMKQIQAGADLFGLLNGGDYHAKISYNGADRGTPGSISWPSTDRQKDKNLAVQGLLRKTFSPLYTLNVSAKGAYDDLQYLSKWGDSRYQQTELQLNTSHKFQLKEWWAVSLAADLAWDKVVSELYTDSRLSTVVALASAFRFDRFKADVALEYAGVFDNGLTTWNSLSPSVDLRFTLVEGLDVVAFGRRAYRTPTFNELYYPGYGNPDLKPEDAWLTDLGIDFARPVGAWNLKFRADGYHNFLSNKIISAPSPEDAWVWLPYNVGKVSAWGVDLLADAHFVSGDWKGGVSARYGWQKALDKTPDSATYNEQIPYVARHTVVLSGDVDWKGLNLNAVYNLRAGRRDGTGEMPNWNTLDLTLGKSFCLGKAGVLGVKVSAYNLFNKRYQVIHDYPMPGRSFMAGIEYKF
jgi:outer membrane cobalamin receptor